MPNKYITDFMRSKAGRFCRNYIWPQRRLWIKTLATSLVVALVVCVSIPREYEARVLTLAEATVVEINNTDDVEALRFNVAKRVRDDIIPSYYKLLFRSRPFLMSVLQSPVMKQDAQEDTLTLYEYVTEDLRYPWWTYLQMGLRQIIGLPGKAVTLLTSADAPDSINVYTPDINRFSAIDTDINRLTRRESAATSLLWKRIGFDVDVDKRGVFFTLRMQDPLVAAIAVDSLVKRTIERVNESRMVKIRRNLAYLEAEKTKALKEYEEAQEAYATYADSNRNLNTLNARKELANLNLRRRIAYQGYTQKATQVSKAKENLVRQHPVLTIIQPSEVPLHPVSQWSAFLWCPLIAIACTTGWLYLKKRSFKLRIKKLKRPAIRRPLLFQRRFSL